MKRYIYLVIISVLTAFQKTAAFAELFNSELDGALKSPTHEPNIMSIIFALLFVIAMIYVTGIIYSKLNVVGAKAAKKQFDDYDLNRAVVLSTTQLGQNRNLHVIEVNGKCYLIGATVNSINLIKELGTIDDIQSDEVFEEIEPEISQIPEDEDIDKAIRTLYANPNDNEAEKVEVEEEFDIHKKYL